MGGGLMQLVAYGAQDIYLTGNPQITFFKVVYRRHTNFAMESIVQTMSGTADFGKEVSVTISRNGDLVGRMYLEHDLVTATEECAMVSNYGSRLMKECELEIGGQKIDKHYGHWHSVWSQLTESNPSGESATLYNKMVGNGLGLNSKGASAEAAIAPSWTGTDAGVITGRIFVPLQFWFCRNPGLALPLIALQYHEVKVKIVFEDLKYLIWKEANAVFGTDENAEVATAPTTKTFDLWTDYIYLDTDERRRFAQVSHEYLIEQLQFSSHSGTAGADATINLNFNHPVKELIWTGGISSVLPTVAGVVTTGRGNTQITAVGGDHSAYYTEQPIAGDWQLKLNGHDRFKAREYRYFTRTQVWQHHTGYGSATNNDSIAVYSFALKPEEHQPSGTCNFSRIDNAQLTGKYSAANTTTAAEQTGGKVYVYAVNYNVLRIMSGMGGLAYSN